MKLYLAPMEGITTYIYRNAYAHYFGGIDKYFTPFIASKKMNRRELNEILPEHNEAIEVVPQILTNRADEFLQITKKIAEYGYQTVNLNLGCPSGTVTARKRGAGFLSVPDELDHFLYEIYDKSPIRISIKTRIGVDSVEEWEHLLALYQKYPVAELIIHARLQREQYRFTPHKEAFSAGAAALLQWGYHFREELCATPRRCALDRLHHDRARHTAESGAGRTAEKDRRRKTVHQGKSPSLSRRDLCRLRCPDVRGNTDTFQDERSVDLPERKLCGVGEISQKNTQGIRLCRVQGRRQQSVPRV